MSNISNNNIVRIPLQGNPFIMEPDRKCHRRGFTAMIDCDSIKIDLRAYIYYNDNSDANMWASWNEKYDIDTNRIFEIDIYAYETDDIDSTRHYWQTFDIETGKEIIKALETTPNTLKFKYRKKL
jgi:hypothetical protein